MDNRVLELNTKIKNAQIVDTMLGFEDHGIFTFYITIKFDCFTCAIGGYNYVYLNDPMIIPKILKTVGVNKWEDLKGQYIRIVDEPKITKIGNIIYEQWLDLEKDYAKKEGTNNE